MNFVFSSQRPGKLRGESVECAGRSHSISITISWRLAIASAMRCIGAMAGQVRFLGRLMDSHREIVTGQTRRSIAGETAGTTPGPRTTPATILLVTVWVGLAAGFLDLGFMILKKRLTDDAFYRLGDHFWWIIPGGVAVLLLVPGIALAVVACLRRGRVALGAVVGLLSFVGFLDVCARLPLELWASLLFSGGLAVQSARLATPAVRCFCG